MKPERNNVEPMRGRLSKSARPVKAEDIAAEIRRQIGNQSPDHIYREKILSQRTRRYELGAPARNTQVEILHTLLGIELKVANRRLLCPDLSTARYLSVFARLGCDVIAIPYDITEISRLADELESGWHRLILLVDHFTDGRSGRLRATVRRRLLDCLRAAIAQSGAGAKFPEFNQKTRQRR